MDYSKVFRIVRAKSGLSQIDFANKLNIDSSLLSRIENGNRKPSKANIKSLSVSFRIPLSLIDLLATSKSEIKNLPSENVQNLTVRLLDVLL